MGWTRAVLIGVALQWAPLAARAETRVFAMPAQPLDTALRAFARTTQRQIVFRSDLVQGRLAEPLAGRLAVEDALRRLLAPSGLVFTVTPAGAYVVSPSPGPTAAISVDLSGAWVAQPIDISVSEVVVTARKREERALEVPIAISAFAGPDLETQGAKNLGDFLQAAPGVGVYDLGNGAQRITIRGISTSLGANENGFYLDELPFTGVTVPISPDVRAWDLERVEVLRGPQGTLFGEGSMGGTVRVLTRNPDLQDWEAKADSLVSTTEGGGTNTGLKATANLPLIDGKLSLRLAGTHEDYSGWIDDRATGRRDLNTQDIDTFRAKLRFKPTDHLMLDASYWYYKGDFAGGGSNATDDGQISQSIVLANTLKYELAGLSARYDLGRAELFYGYSHNAFDLPQSGSLFGGTLSSTIGIRVDAHELRLASTGQGALQWTLGAYQRTSERQDAFMLSLFGLDNRDQTHSKAQAVFGEATYTLPDAPIDLTAGLRYFRDELGGQETNAGVVTPDAGHTYHSLNPRFSLAWRPRSNLNLYVSAAKGFRSGQLQPTMPSGIARQLGVNLPAALGQDSIWTYEAGAKAEFLERRVSLEAAVYHSRWKDVTVRVPLGATGFNGLINSKGTQTNGIEASLTARPTSTLTLSAGTSYADATYTGSVAGTGITDGAPVDDIAKFTANAAVDYRRPISAQATLLARLAWQHNSPRRFTSFAAYLPSDAIDHVDARLGVAFPKVALSLFADNLTNEGGATSFRSVQALAAGRLDVIANRLRPRTIGLQARVALDALFGRRR
ncbi:TonB-dependent receptor [uncultured Caulobacter sp.]|uniref:TonB-dependent receptor domain-containing protein n=1 Tax=uncultured Caulobacter sp. TaxID=158749 RepID=UPI00260632C4|nr:TonB-dependent receptor [uncultured Caulobacter sp.]